MGQSLIDFAKSYGKTQNTDKGGPKAAARRGKPDFRGTKGPASLRFNNPGAQWPGPISKKWGAVDSVTLNDGQGNKIAVFGDAITGGAALYDLLDKKYAGKTLKGAIAKWSGGNSSKAYAARISKATGVGLNTVITHQMLRDPEFAVPFALEMANHEMGGKHPMTADDWAEAHRMFQAGSPEAAATESFGRGGADMAGMGLMSGGPMAAGGDAMDGGALGLFGGGTSSGATGAPTGQIGTAPAPDFSPGPGQLPSAIGTGMPSGEFGMDGMQGMGRQATKAAEIAKALAAPSMDSSLMGGGLAPAPKAAPDVQMVDLVDAPTAPPAPNYGLDEAFNDAWSGLKDAFSSPPATEATPAFDRSYSSQDLGGLPGWSNEGLPDMPRYGHELGPISTAFGAAPNISTTGLNAVNSADSYGFSSDAMGKPMSDPRAAIHRDGLIDADVMSAAPEMSPMTADFSSELDAPSYGANFGALKGMGSPPSLMGLVSPIGDISMDDSFGFSLGAPSFGSEMSLASPTSAPSMSISDVSPAAASALGGQSQFAGIGAPDGMAYGGTGAFGGIGSPTADQAAQGQKGLSAAASALGKANGVTSIAKALGPLDAFHDAFASSVKSVGPKAKAAFAAAYADPKSVEKSLAAIDATRAYSNMNGQPSKAVAGLRSQQIGDFAMANPSVGNALGLSMGQQGQQGLGGGIGSDPFGGGRGPMGGPGFGAGLGGGGPGQPSGPSFGGPSGPSAGPSGVTGRGPSSNPGSGGGLSGGPGAGPGYGGGNPGGSPSPGGVTTGRGPSSNPGSGAGLSAAAASAIGAALSHEAAAAAASDAARGFGGYGMGPSFSGGFF